MGTGVFFKYHPEEDFGGKRVLNAGCGFAKFHMKNVVNMDAFDNCSPDVVWSMENTPLPFKDGEFDIIIANHVLEHVKNWWACLNDMARILKVGGKMEIWVPGDGTDTQLGYRDHVSFINDLSFFGIGNLQRIGTNAWAGTEMGKSASCLFLIDHKKVLKTMWWIRFAPKPLQKWMAYHLRNIAMEDGFIFEKRGKQ